MWSGHTKFQAPILKNRLLIVVCMKRTLICISMTVQTPICYCELDRKTIRRHNIDMCSKWPFLYIDTKMAITFLFQIFHLLLVWLIYIKFKYIFFIFMQIFLYFFHSFNIKFYTISQVSQSKMAELLTNSTQPQPSWPILPLGDYYCYPSTITTTVSYFIHNRYNSASFLTRLKISAKKKNLKNIFEKKMKKFNL